MDPVRPIKMRKFVGQYNSKAAGFHAVIARHCANLSTGKWSAELTGARPHRTIINGRRGAYIGPLAQSKAAYSLATRPKMKEPSILAFGGRFHYVWSTRLGPSVSSVNQAEADLLTTLSLSHV